MVNRRSDDAFARARNLQLNRRVKDVLGQRDRVDFYKFTASSQIDFTLALTGLQANANVRLLNANRAQIDISNKRGRRPESIVATLGVGTYYIEVRFADRRGTTRYNLLTSATPTPPVIPPPVIPPPVTPPPPPPAVGDNTLGTAFDIGVLATTYIKQETVGTNDPVDFYKFTLNDIANLQIRLDNSASGTRVELIRDSNNNGLIDSGETLSSDRSTFSLQANLAQDLPPGIYFARVIPPSSSTSTQYQISLVPTLFGGNISPEPGNTLPTARDLGVVSGTSTAREYVGIVDLTDLYKFTLNDISNVQLQLSGSSTSTIGRLIRDTNNNGLIDNGEVITFSNFTSGSSFPTALTQDLPPGTYFIDIKTIDDTKSTSYEMNLVVTPFGGSGLPDPGNTLLTARDLGVLSGTFSTKEYVGFLDLNDFYKFTLNNTASLQARADSSSIATQIQLIRDANSNGLIDNNETLESVTPFFGSTLISSFTRSLSSGVYFIRMSPRNGNPNESTSYTLSLTV